MAKCSALKCTFASSLAGPTHLRSSQHAWAASSSVVQSVNFPSSCVLPLPPPVTRGWVIGLQLSLYGAECWILLRKHARKLNTFHHGCVRIILGISNKQQWSEHITVAEARRRCWGHGSVCKLTGGGAVGS